MIFPLLELQKKPGTHQRVFAQQERMIENREDFKPFMRKYTICLLGTVRCSYLVNDKGDFGDWTYDEQKSKFFDTAKEASSVLSKLPSWSFSTAVVLPCYAWMFPTVNGY